MKKALTILLSLILVLGLSLSFIGPVSAIGPPDKITEMEYLGPNEVRFNPYVRAEKVRTFTREGKPVEEWGAVVNSLPETMPDLKTKITIEWRRGQGEDGVKYWITGNNIYQAIVTGTRVSVEYNGILAAWNPDIYVGNTELELRNGPTPTKDFYDNENYTRPNCIKWVYEVPRNAFEKFFGGESIKVTRYIRQIEGMLQEFYVLEENPNGDLKIVNNYQEEEGFKWNKGISAWDSRGYPIEITGNVGEKIVSRGEFGRIGLVYPIIVDPPTPFTSSFADGWIQSNIDEWDTVRDASTGYNIEDSNSSHPWTMSVYGDTDYPNDFDITRSFFYMETEDLPDDSEISAATFKLYGRSNYDSSVSIQKGTQGSTLSTSDYNNFSGSLYGYTSWNPGYNNIAFDTTGIADINKTGITKLCAREYTHDYLDSPPNDYYDNGCYFSEQGAGYQPLLEITYEITLANPVVTTQEVSGVTSSSAILHGTLVDDGGADASVWFDYGTTDSYGDSTPPQGDYSSGEAFLQEVYLEAGTLYHYTGRAENSAESPSADDDVTFLVKPYKPTSFVATPGDGENALTWSKGTGSDKTKIIRSETGYPTSITDGTQVYFDTGTSETDSDVDNGTTYYYSAWGYTEDGTHTEYSPDYATISGIPIVEGAPSIETRDATQVTETTAQLEGYLVSMQGAGSVTVSFEYKETGGEYSPVASDEGALTEIGPFTKDIAGLDAETTYIVKAKGVGYDAEIGWGDEVPFTTSDVSAPTMTTNPTSTTYADQATLYGEVTDDGGGSVTAWFDWGETESCGTPTDSLTGYGTGDEIQPFTLEGLEPDTTYYYQVIGQNSGGTHSGGILSFETQPPSDPEVTTVDPAKNIGASSATLEGDVTNTGGVDAKARFQWSTDSTLSTNTSESGWQEEIEGFFDQFIDGLEVGVDYYFRAQVQHDWSGTINGSIVDFTTIFTAPTSFTALPLTYTSTELNWIPQGDQTLIKGKIGSYPIDRLDGYQVYFGPGSSKIDEGLLPGTTYFYRAWSWRSGDVYTTAYAEDASTTLSGVRPGDISTPTDVIREDAPEAPSWFWQTPSSDNIQRWPGVSLIDSVAEGMGMPNGTMWVIISGLAAVLFGATTATFLPLPWAALLGGGLAVIILSLVGVLAGWFIILYLIIGVAIIFVLVR